MGFAQSRRPIENSCWPLHSASGLKGPFLKSLVVLVGSRSTRRNSLSLSVIDSPAILISPSQFRFLLVRGYPLKSELYSERPKDTPTRRKNGERRTVSPFFVWAKPASESVRPEFLAHFPDSRTMNATRRTRAPEKQTPKERNSTMGSFALKPRL